MRRIAVLAALLGAVLLALGGAMAAATPSQGPGKGPKDRTAVTLQFLNFSDWHGQLEPISVFGVGEFGGAAFLATYFANDRAAHDGPTLTLTAGDAYGATPPISSFFDEEPAVRALRMMGLDIDTFGNHNFDRGIEHLQRMIDIASATEGEPGQPFQYVSANLANRDDNLSGVSDWHIFDLDGVKVGVVGLTNEEAPTLVTPGNFGTIEITDSVRAANKARAEMKRAGAQVMVAITHKGVRGFDAFGNPVGELIDFAENVGGFDLIFGDHTNFEWAGVIGKALVSMNLSKGMGYSKTFLTVDPVNGRVIDRSIEFVVPTTAGVTPDPEIQAMIDDLREELAPILGTVIGESTVRITRADECGRSDGRLCESLVGNVTTDALRTTYDVDFAVTNSGGLRAELTCPGAGEAGFCPEGITPPPFPITRGSVLGVLPFGNVVATLDVDGALLKEFLENGVSRMPGADGRFPQVSGMCFTYDVNAPAGSRVTLAVRQAADGTCTGGPVDLTSASTYSLAINDFMASGGDEYPDVSALIVTRELMDQVVADYIEANSPISPAIQGRITCTGDGCPPPAP
jgi:2',3'-cyclic-nucleotide 2'-phosphodiesterase (5'-nucleotidase family)